MAKQQTTGRERIGGSDDDLDFMVVRDKNGKVILDTLNGITPDRGRRTKKKQRAVRITRT